MNISEELKIYAKHLKVLVVEDDNFIRNELKEIFSYFYRDVKVAEDGLEGIKLFRKEKFDIIITDLEMPNMNGIEFAKEVKLLNNDQVIIVLSGYLDDYVIELVDMGITQLVLKPFQYNKFIRMLSSISENIILAREFEKAKSYNIAHKIFQVQKNVPIPHNSAYREVVNTIANQKIKDIKKMKKEEISLDDDISSYFNKKQISVYSLIDDLHKDVLTWKSFENNIDELIFIEEDFSHAINNMYLENEISQEILDMIVEVLNRIDNLFKIIDKLVEMARIILKLSTFLSMLNLASLDESQKKELKVIEFIYEDISEFLQKIFIQQDSIDVNYLQDSLESSIDIIVSNIKNEKLEEDNLEIELF
jgi:YesN/AraC family two-component response regulator